MELGLFDSIKTRNHSRNYVAMTDWRVVIRKLNVANWIFSQSFIVKKIELNCTKIFILTDRLTLINTICCNTEHSFRSNSFLIITILG